jgi:hypothetical protein
VIRLLRAVPLHGPTTTHHHHRRSSSREHSDLWPLAARAPAAKAVSRYCSRPSGRWGRMYRPPVMWAPCCRKAESAGPSTWPAEEAGARGRPAAGAAWATRRGGPRGRAAATAPASGSARGRPGLEPRRLPPPAAATAISPLSNRRAGAAPVARHAARPRSPNILTQITMLKHKKASELWNWLQATYGTTSQATKQSLFKKIFCGPAVPPFDKFDVRTFIEEKVDAQNQFNENCRTTTEKIGDNLICFSILAGLPLEYNIFKTTIAVTLESLTVTGLMEKLLNEETQIRMSRATNGHAEPTKSTPEKPVDLKAYLGQSLEKAVEAMNNQNRSKHQHKHNKDKQKNRIPVLGGGVQKHGHDRHGNGGGGRGGDKGTKTCHHCGKPGHLKVNCWHNPASKNFRGNNPKTTTAHVAVRDF